MWRSQAQFMGKTSFLELKFETGLSGIGKEKWPATLSRCRPEWQDAGIWVKVGAAIWRP
jgi:hypothetical protein